MPVYWRVESESSMPSFGRVSRMLFISMFMNTASNCCAACRTACFCPSALVSRDLRLSDSSPLASRANVPEVLVLAIFAVVMTWRWI